MNKASFSLSLAVVAIGMAVISSARLSDWQCESPNIMDCSDLAGGDPFGSTPCITASGFPGTTSIGACGPIYIYVCNGRNENCDLGQGCNVMVKYPAEGCRVYCNRTGAGPRPTPDQEQSFLGWCASSELQSGQAMNLKCSIEDEPCTGTTPEPMPPTEPIYEPGPGENPVPYQSPVFVPVEP